MILLFLLQKIIHSFSDGQVKPGKLVQILRLLLCGASVCTTPGVYVMAGERV